jgi:hypothetical protein
MPRIKCHYIDCVFLDEGYCSAAAIELDPDTGCATYSPSDEAAAAAEEWEEEEEEWEEEEGDEEDDELWDEEEDEF